MKWQQAYHWTKANKITRVTTSERDRKNLQTSIIGHFCSQIKSTTRGRNQASLEGYLIFSSFSLLKASLNTPPINGPFNTNL